MLLVPSLLVVAFVALYPLGKTIFQSFTDEQFLALNPVSWVGLENYKDLWNDTIFRDSIWTTIKFTLITVAFEFALGLAIALIVNSSFKGRGVMRVTRPASSLKTHYNEGSKAIYQGINQILNGRSASSVLPGVESKLNRILR